MCSLPVPVSAWCRSLAGLFDIEARSRPEAPIPQENAPGNSSPQARMKLPTRPNGQIEVDTPIPRGCREKYQLSCQ